MSLLQKLESLAPAELKRVKVPDWNQGMEQQTLVICGEPYHFTLPSLADEQWINRHAQSMADKEIYTIVHCLKTTTGNAAFTLDDVSRLKNSAAEVIDRIYLKITASTHKKQQKNVYFRPFTMGEREALTEKTGSDNALFIAHCFVQKSLNSKGSRLYKDEDIEHLMQTANKDALSSAVTAFSAVSGVDDFLK